MARIDFHSGVANKLSYCCRLLRKILQSPTAEIPARNVIVIGEVDFLKQLDKELWSFSATDFVPHAWSHDDFAAETPIILSPSFKDPALQELPHADVILNAGPELAEDMQALAERFPRIIDIVSTQTKELEAGRERCKVYRGLGHELHNFDQSKQA